MLRERVHLFVGCQEKFTLTRNISETEREYTYTYNRDSGSPKWTGIRGKNREGAENYITNRLSRFSQVYIASVCKGLKEILCRGLASKAKKLFIFHVQRSFLRPRQKCRIFLLVFFSYGLIQRTRVYYAFNQFGQVFFFTFYGGLYDTGGGREKTEKRNNSELYSFTTNNISRLFSSRLDDLHFPCVFTRSPRP